jgi:hypothetical protein
VTGLNSRQFKFFDEVPIPKKIYAKLGLGMRISLRYASQNHCWIESNKKPPAGTGGFDASALAEMGKEIRAALRRRIVRQFYFFIVPPGVVASPFFSAEPAVAAPWLLASLAEGIELPVVAPVALFFIVVPPPAVVPPSMESPVVVLLAAGPPACEFPPAVLLLVCASASVLERASAAASAIDFAIMVVSSGYGPGRKSPSRRFLFLR